MGWLCNAGTEVSIGCPSPPVDVDDRREFMSSVDSAEPVDVYCSDAASFVASLEGYMHIIWELASENVADADLWEVPSISILYKSPCCLHPDGSGP